MALNEAESCFRPKNVSRANQLAADGASREGDARSEAFEAQHCTLESSLGTARYIVHDSPSSTGFSTVHRSTASSQHCYPGNHHAASPQCVSCVTEDPNDLRNKLRELEKEMLGPDSDVDSYDSSFPGQYISPDILEQLMVTPTDDLRQVLIACAKAMDENNYCTVELLIGELQKMVSVSGEPIARLGAYLLEGIIAKLASSGSTIYKSLKCKEPTGPKLLSYMHMLYEICPYFKFGYLSANGAIAEAVKGESLVHIIDFQIAQGSQWVTLIQALATRPGGPPCLRITGIDDKDSTYARGGGLHLVGQRLCKFAESWGVSMEFYAVPVTAADVELHHLVVHPGEAIVVNFPYVLHHVPDESVSIANPRDRILRMVKSLSPVVVTLVEQESNTNTTLFFPRFLETLDYYSAMFESIDVTRPRDDKERIEVEQHCVARDIVNIIACEGFERVERHELFGKWRSRFLMAGFKPYPLSTVVNGAIKALLGSYCSNYRLEERDGVLYLGWMNRVLVVSSAWR